jgi:hypothetical protein
MPLQWRQTLGELVRIMAAQRSADRPEDLISREAACHEVRVESKGRSRIAG